MKSRPIATLLATLTIFCVSICGSVQAADIDNYRWSEIDPKGDEVSGRHECALVEFDGELYLLGGRGVLEVGVYNPKSNKWTRRSKSPIEINHFQAIVYGDAIYLVGAMNGRYPVEEPLENVWIYKPREDRWLKGAEIPEEHRRGGAGCVLYRDKIYVVCGIEFGHTSGTTNIFSCYDPKDDSWSTLTKAPHIRDHFAAVVLDDKLYCIGGRNSSVHYPNNFGAFFNATTPEVDIYDFESGKWYTNPHNLPTPTAAGGVVAVGNSLIYMGGEGESKMAYSQTQCLDTQSGEWRALSPMTSGRHGSGAVLLNGAIYWVGGSYKQGGSDTNNIYKFSLNAYN